MRRARAIVAVGIAALVVGCSTASDRFGPFDQTSSTQDPGHPGSIHTGSANQADDGSFSRDVAAQPLDAPSQSSTPAYTQQAVHTPSSSHGEVTVRPGDTLYSISRNHNVNVGDLIAVNSLQPPYNIQAGQRLTLPGASTAQAASYTPTDNSANHVVNLPTTHTVRRGETLYSISRSYGHRPETVAAYNDLDNVSVVRIGQNLRIPTRDWRPSTTTTASQQQTPAVQNANQSNSAPAQQDQQQAAVQPAAAPSAPAETTTNADERGDRVALTDTEMPAMTSSRFRWPVRGRIISNFGEKADGSRNDGINLAVPEGTSVKAAENGVVAYAGNELQGYGNLILIRHADNWVSAYAHNSELFVRRGDVVSRGQIIAKAGQTGNVTSPQLHFEIRQGAQAVDPLQHLAPNTVASE